MAAEIGEHRLYRPAIWNWKMITDSFRSMKEKFGYPDSIKMCPLGDRYRFRPNGDFMLLFYCDRANGCISILWNKGLRMSRGLLSGKASGTGRNIMQEGCINPGNCSRSWDIRLQKLLSKVAVSYPATSFPRTATARRSGHRSS